MFSSAERLLQIGGFYKKEKRKKEKQIRGRPGLWIARGSHSPHHNELELLLLLRPGSLWLINDLPPRFVHVCFETLRSGIPPCCRGMCCAAAGRGHRKGFLHGLLYCQQTEDDEPVITTQKASGLD